MSHHTWNCPYSSESIQTFHVSHTYYNFSVLVSFRSPLWRILSANQPTRQTTWSTVSSFMRRKGQWPSLLVGQTKLVKTIKVEKYDRLGVWVCVCVCVCSLSSQVSAEMAPDCVSLPSHCQKKSIPACHSGEDPFGAGIFLCYRVMSTFFCILCVKF